MTKKFFQAIYTVGKTTINGISNHGIFTFAASIAFYTIFSLPGLLITVTLIAGFFLEKSTVEAELITQLQSFIGYEPAQTIGNLLEKTEFSQDTLWKTIFGIGTLLFSATTIFISLQEALNRIWDVRAVPEKGIVKYLINRVLSFGVIISIGFLLLVSLLLDTLFQLFFNSIKDVLGTEPAMWLEFFNELISLIVVFTIIYLIFKMLPDVILSWRDVSLATLITVVLLFFGKFLISVYIANSDFSKTYDAAGSIIVILMWVYYSTVVLLTGAEITRALMLYRRRPIRPSNGAKKIRVQELDFEEYKSEINRMYDSHQK